MSSANPPQPRSGASVERAHEHGNPDRFRFQYRGGVAHVADGDREIVIAIQPREFIHISTGQRSIVAGTRDDREARLRDLERRHAGKLDAALRRASEAAAAFDPAREEVAHPARRNTAPAPAIAPGPRESPGRPAAPAAAPTPPQLNQAPQGTPTAPEAANCAEDPEASADDPFGLTTTPSRSPTGVTPAPALGGVPPARSESLRAAQLRILELARQRELSTDEEPAASPPRAACPPPASASPAEQGPPGPKIHRSEKRRRRVHEYRGQMFLWPGFGDSTRQEILARPDVMAATDLLRRYELYNAPAIVLQVGPDKAAEAVRWFHAKGGEGVFRDPPAAIARYCLRGLGRRLAPEPADDGEIPADRTEAVHARQVYKERAHAR